MARYADVWNAQGLGPEQLRERSAMLDELLRAAGRQPENVRRTLATPLVCGRTPEEIAAQIRAYEAAGITEVIAQWSGVDDIEGLEVFAAELLPRLAPATA